jgi:two-component system chemotaxis response regulator CheY
MYLRQKIEQGEFRVIAEAKNGEEAINHFDSKQPDIALLDLTMPKVDGLIALKEIMKINPHAKVIVVSATGTNYTVMEAIQLGSKDFIVKPHFERMGLFHRDSEKLITMKSTRKCFIWKNVK